MNHKDKALRIAFVAFRSLQEGNSMSPDDFRALANVMAIALPMKLRWTHEELEKIKTESAAVKGINVLAGCNAKVRT